MKTKASSLLTFESSPNQLHPCPSKVALALAEIALRSRSTGIRTTGALKFFRKQNWANLERKRRATCFIYVSLRFFSSSKRSDNFAVSDVLLERQMGLFVYSFIAVICFKRTASFGKIGSLGSFNGQYFGKTVKQNRRFSFWLYCTQIFLLIDNRFSVFNYDFIQFWEFSLYSSRCNFINWTIIFTSSNYVPAWIVWS